MVVEETTSPAHPLEDGRTRCSWVEGHPDAYAFHDAEYGMIPDVDDLTRERVFLVCLQRDMPLVEALSHRQSLWDAFRGYDLKALESLDDAWLDATAAKGGALADRTRLAWMRDVARAVTEIAKQAKELREYFLAVRFLTAEEQFADVGARFPGFGKEDAANLMAILGTLEGSPHERDCWRA